MKNIFILAFVLLVFFVESEAQTQISNISPVNIIGGIGQLFRFQVMDLVISRIQIL
jgi:hypothetical protein